MNSHQTLDELEFSTSAVRRVGILSKENESLRQEMAQMRITAIQQKQQHKEEIDRLQQQLRELAGGNNNNNNGNNNDSSSSSPSKAVNKNSAVSFDTRKGNNNSMISLARRERVKVSFSLMSVKHAMQRLRNSVDELRTGVDSDFIDAAKMIDVKKKSIDGRIAIERPLVHKIHDAICELVRHGGNQKAETLQHLFSATSWGHTRMSLTQAAPDIVHELEGLVAVAEQQRRAKEILEVATIHKERSLERANKAVMEMATTARNVVATFAQMARDVHSMAQQQSSSSSSTQDHQNSAVKSILVTRALTIPDLEKYIPQSKSSADGNKNTTKSSELSLKQIEKFARHLQDSAYAATTLLQSATQAVLEPETATTNNINNNVSSSLKKSPSPNTKRRKSISFQDEISTTTNINNNNNDNDDDDVRSLLKNINSSSTPCSPGLVQVLRRRWIKSIFERAMLRMKFKKCLETIHDDFVLNNLVYEVDNNINNNKKNNNHSQEKEKDDKQQPENTTGASRWSSAFVKPTAPVSSSSSSTTTKKTLANNHHKDSSSSSANQHQQQQDTTSTNNNSSHQHQWSSEDERRLKLHEQRHSRRVKQLLNLDHEDTNDIAAREKKTKEMRETVHRKLIDLSASLDDNNNHDNNNTSSNLVHNAHRKQDARKQLVPSRFLKPTLTTSRRALPPPSAILGKIGPLTGTVDVGNDNNNTDGNGDWKRMAKSDFMGVTSTGSVGANGTSALSFHSGKVTTSTNQDIGSRTYRNPHNDVTEGIRTSQPKWFQPAVTKNQSSTMHSTTTKMVPQPPSNNQFSNVPMRDTLKQFFVLNDM